MKSPVAHILYVEDHEDTRDLVTYVLAQSKCTVVAVENYDDALLQARAHHFDLYLIDSWIVGGSGIELCRKLREFDPRTPILFFSAAAYDQDKQQAFAAGAEGYLVKPATSEELMKEVCRLISARKEPELECAYGAEPAVMDERLLVKPAAGES
jgi:DNA-binding response OmpR family regulator